MAYHDCLQEAKKLLARQPTTYAAGEVHLSVPKPMLEDLVHRLKMAEMAVFVDHEFDCWTRYDIECNLATRKMRSQEICHICERFMDTELKE